MVIDEPKAGEGVTEFEVGAADHRLVLVHPVVFVHPVVWQVHLVRSRPAEPV